MNFQQRIYSLLLQQQCQQHHHFVLKGSVQIQHLFHVQRKTIKFVFSIYDFSFLSHTNLFTQSNLPTRISNSQSQFSFASKPVFSTENQPTRVIQHKPSPVETIRSIVPIPEPLPKMREQIIQPPAPPPPVARRLSTNSMDTFADELYEQMIDPLIRETTCNIFE